MGRDRLSIAIVGAGIGGLAAAATLRRFGMHAEVYEQAPQFARIGAGIQMMPNSVKVLRRIGVEERVRGTSFAPYSHLNRVWDTGEVTRELGVADAPLPDRSPRDPGRLGGVWDGEAAGDVGDEVRPPLLGLVEGCSLLGLAGQLAFGWHNLMVRGEPGTFEINPAATRFSRWL